MRALSRIFWLVPHPVPRIPVQAESAWAGIFLIAKGNRGPPVRQATPSSALWLRIFLVDVLSFRQHALMEDARYQDPLAFNPVEENMPPVFHAAQARPDVIAGATHLGVVCKLAATGFEIVNVTDGLILSPSSQRVSGDVQKVSLGKARQAVCSHRLAFLRLRPLKCLPHPRERVSLGNSAGVAFINRGSQGGKLRLKLPFLPLQGSQRRADYLAGVFVPATLDLRQYEAVKLIRQIHISSRHGNPLNFQSEAKDSMIGKVCQQQRRTSESSKRPTQAKPACVGHPASRYFPSLQMPTALPLVASVIVLLAAAVIASVFPAERAARFDVTEALRSE